MTSPRICLDTFPQRLYNNLKDFLVFWDEEVFPLLTPRQKEFLKMVWEHYLKHKTPVHYTDVASRVGVSKWTAYDILKRLCREGYLVPQYLTGATGGSGRSALFYLPAPGLERLFPREEADAHEEWLAWKERLLRCLAKGSSGEASSPVEELLSLFPEAKGPLKYCSLVLALFIAHLQAANRRGVGLLRRVVNFVTKPEQRLSLFTGMTLGVLSRLPRTSPEKAGVLLEFTEKYHHYLSRFSLKQCRLLDSFLGDLLDFC